MQPKTPPDLPKTLKMESTWLQNRFQNGPRLKKGENQLNYSQRSVGMTLGVHFEYPKTEKTMPIASRRRHAPETRHFGSIGAPLGVLLALWGRPWGSF